MLTALRTWYTRSSWNTATWYTRLRDRAGAPPPGDRGSNTTETVIWIAALAALALTVAGLFGAAIIDAAHDVVFQ